MGTMANRYVTACQWKNLKRMLMLGVCSLVACATSPQTDEPADENQSKQSVEEIAMRIHEDIFVLDGHADIATPTLRSIYLASDGKSKVDPIKLQQGGVDAVVMAIAVPPGPRSRAGDKLGRDEADDKLALVNKLVADNDNLEFALSSKDIPRLIERGKIAIILSMQNARMLEGKPKNVVELFDSGVRVFGLNHIGHNDFSDSSRPRFDRKTATFETDEEHGGLSQLGVDAIHQINALGGVLDVSQMSKNATLQAIRLSLSPVVASHSNARSLSDTSRNLSDEEIDLIAANGGVINVVPFGGYLADYSSEEVQSKINEVRASAGLPARYSYPYELYWEIRDTKRRTQFLVSMQNAIGVGSVETLVDQIDYIQDRVGIDHVGIGSDFNHGGGVVGYQDASEARNITIALVERGYTEKDINKIWGLNFLRVWGAAEDTRPK